jgi:hypothetical protein
MWEIPRLLMAVGGVWMLLIGIYIYRKNVWEAVFGCCIFGSAVFGYLGKSNEVYSWLQLAFIFALVLLAIVRLVLQARAA